MSRFMRGVRWLDQNVIYPGMEVFAVLYFGLFLLCMAFGLLVVVTWAVCWALGL